MAGHSFPVSLGLPRWRPCQIPDPGEGTLSQFPVGSPPPPPPPPPPPWGLTLIGAKRVPGQSCLVGNKNGGKRGSICSCQYFQELYLETRHGNAYFSLHSNARNLLTGSGASPPFSLHVRESLDSGLHAGDSGFQELDSRFVVIGA